MRYGLRLVADSSRQCSLTQRAKLPSSCFLRTAQPSLFCPFSLYTSPFFMLSHNYPKHSKRHLTYIKTTFSPPPSLKRATDNPFSTGKIPVWLSITIKWQPPHICTKDKNWVEILWLNESQCWVSSSLGHSHQNVSAQTAPVQRRLENGGTRTDTRGNER